MASSRKKQKRGLIILTVIFAIIIGLLALTWSSNTHLTKTKYEVTSDKLPSEFDGYKMIQISDLHDKEFGDNNENLFKLVEKESPDVIVTTGDMLNSTDTPEDYQMAIDILGQLVNNYDVYYIDGNHETAMNVINSDYYKQWITSIDKVGVKILDNEKTVLKHNGASIDLYGLWYNGRYYNNMGDESAEKYYLDVEHIENLIGSPDSSRFNLLLSHNPVYFDVYANWGADLTLTGHMHGGVIRIPFKGGLISPERVYWPEYDAGEFKTISDSGNESTMIVNRGLGNGNAGYRFFNWPDVSVITLKSQS